MRNTSAGFSAGEEKGDKEKPSLPQGAAGIEDARHSAVLGWVHGPWCAAAAGADVGCASRRGGISTFHSCLVIAMLCSLF